MTSVALLRDAFEDVGYCNQRPDLAGEETDRETLSRYPIVITGDASLNARAILYTSVEGEAWSPLERRRKNDTTCVFVTPIGDVIQRHGLRNAKPWLPLCLALLEGRDNVWITLEEDIGHVFIKDGRIHEATLHRKVEAESVDAGLYAARLGGARSMPIDCPLFALASARGVAEHLDVNGVADDAWASPDGVLLFNSIVSKVPPPTADVVPWRFGPRAPESLPRRMLPLWKHLSDHRYGFDLLRKGAPIVADITIDLGSATLLAQWVRVNTSSNEWKNECHARSIPPKDALPWMFRVVRYVHGFADDMPAFAAQQAAADSVGIIATLGLAARDMMIIGVFV
jgi:hypothetical protein